VRTVDEETATSSLGELLGLGKVKEREAYEALDWLLGHQARIENGLARRHLEDCDVSSSYFEGRHCPLARYGHRRDRPQIVYGLLCTREGLPIAVESSMATRRIRRRWRRRSGSSRRASGLTVRCWWATVA